MASAKAQLAKDKGNGAFKLGDYPTAIGHYTSAILADRNDHTLPLNRAAAYLKLGKNEDAEKDCTTVLSLSASNVKALFRRGQARVAIGKYSEAQKDFQEALRLESGNEAVKQELKKVGQLIEKIQGKSRAAPIDVVSSSNSTPSTATPPPKRRRISITIVEPPSSTTLSTSTSSSSNAANIRSASTVPDSKSELLNAVSSRPLTSPPPAPSPASAPPAAVPPPSIPKPSTFKEAKQSRESVKPSRTGGGIFRPGGDHTIFIPKARSPESLQPTSSTQPPAASVPVSQVKALLATNNTPAKTPMTLFTFSKVWEQSRSADVRWKLLSTIPPASLPSMFQTSLEASILASILETLLATLKADEGSKDDVRAYMVNLAPVPRFGTVLLFLSQAEKGVAKEIWERLGKDGSANVAWGIS